MPKQTQYHVLVAEEHDTWRGLITRGLERVLGEGSASISKKTFDGALVALNRHKFDAVVVSGTFFRRGFLQRMQQDHPNPPPIYVMSALDYTVEDAQSQGITAYAKMDDQVVKSLSDKVAADLGV